MQSTTLSHSTGQDKVKENRKSLSEKTLKLIEATSAISDTLSQLERKSSKIDKAGLLLMKASSSSILLEEPLLPALPAIASQLQQATASTTIIAADNSTPNNITATTPAKQKNIEIDYKPIESNQALVEPSESVVASAIVEKTIEAVAPTLVSSLSQILQAQPGSNISPSTEKEVNKDANAIKSHTKASISAYSRPSKDSKSQIVKQIKKDGTEEKVHRVKKIEPISSKEKAPELQKQNESHSKENVQTATAKAITTQTSFVIVDSKGMETEQEHGPSISKIQAAAASSSFNVSHLHQRIAFLENQLEESTKNGQSAHSVLLSKFESAKHHNQDLQMRNSRQELEIKSLLEQNEALRTENRRVAELESNMRLRVIELSQPKPELEKTPLDSSDLIYQERIVHQLDEQLGWISIHCEETKGNSSLAKHLRAFEATFEDLKKSVKGVLNASPKYVLSICRTLTDIASQSLKQSWDSNKQVFSLEEKLEILQKDSSRADKDALDRIHHLNESHDQQVAAILTSQKQLKQQFNGLLDKYNIVKDENEELRTANDELYADNQTLLTIVQKPEEPKEVFLLNDPQSKASDDHIESLNKANHELRLKVTQLTQTIESWKFANHDLQQELSKIVHEKSGHDTNILKLSSKISALENEVQDEKLTGQKAAELIKSLQNEIEELQKSKQSPNIEKIIANQMAAFNSFSGAGERDESIYEAHILSFVKDTHTKVKQIQDLEISVKDCNFAIAKLEEENSKLKSRSAQLKDKFQVRELAWLERLKNSKEELDLITTEFQSLKDNLRSYKEQYDSIKCLHIFSSQVLTFSDAHPYSFAQLFNQLTQKSSHSDQRCEELEKNLLDTKHAYNDTSKDLLVQKQQFEALGTETKSTRNQLVEISGIKATLESKIHYLEEQLKRAQSEKESIQHKLKDVVGKMIEYVHLTAII